MSKVLLWTLSTRCNLNCKYCYYKQEARSSRKILDIEKSFAHIQKISPDIIYFSGEPTIINDIDKIIDRVRLIIPKAKIIFTTNGLLLKGELLDKLLAIVDMFLISLGGHSEYINNIFRSNFAEVVSNIKCLNLKRAKYSNKVLLGINAVIHKTNVNEIKEIIAYFKNTLQSDYVHLQPIYLEEDNHISLERSELLILSNTIRSIKEKVPSLHLSSNIYLNALENYANKGSFGIKCSNGVDVFFLNENQDVMSCPSPFMVKNGKCQESLNCINMVEISQSKYIFNS